MKFSRGIFHYFVFYFHFWLFPVTVVHPVPGGGRELIIGVPERQFRLVEREGQ